MGVTSEDGQAVGTGSAGWSGVVGVGWVVWGFIGFAF